MCLGSPHPAHALLYFSDRVVLAGLRTVLACDSLSGGGEKAMKLWAEESSCRMKFLLSARALSARVMPRSLVG